MCVRQCQTLLFELNDLWPRYVAQWTSTSLDWRLSRSRTDDIIAGSMPRVSVQSQGTHNNYEYKKKF